jgi:hypothetical protein
MIDDAWGKRGSPFSNNSTMNDEYVIDMGEAVGTLGEQSIKIVVEQGTRRFITAHPL